MEIHPTSRAARNAMQDAWLDRRMQDNPRWAASAQSLSEFKPIRERKAFIAWRVGPDGEPLVIAVLRSVEVGISFTGGLSVTFSSTSAKEPTLRVTSHPREIVPGLFAWIPLSVEVRYYPFKPNEPDSVSRCSLLMMTRSVSQSDKVHLSSYKEFTDRWPEIQV